MPERGCALENSTPLILFKPGAEEPKPTHIKTIESFNGKALNPEASPVTEQEEKNNFPLEVFPPGIQQIIRETHKCLTYPIDYIAAGLIHAASVAIGNTVQLQSIEGWIESPVFYIVLVGRSGSNKSAPLDYALKPLLARDEAAYREYQLLNQEYEKIATLSKKERKTEGISDPEKPKLKKCIMQDFTMEALVRVHAANPRGIGVYADELASWFKNFTRYNSGSEEQFWLSSWSGKSYSSDRVSSEPVRLSKPFISVIGGIQVSLLYELGKGSKGQNGFLERMLFAYPENQEKPHLSFEKINPEVSTNWDWYLSNLLKLNLKEDENQNPRPTILKFSQEAEVAFRKWQWQNTEFINSQENDTVRSIFSKLDSYLIRFSLLLQMIFWATNEGEKDRVELKAVEGAIKLVEHYRRNALKVHGFLGRHEPIVANDVLADPLAFLAANKRELLEKLPLEFTTAEAIIQGSLLEWPIKERAVKAFLKQNPLLERTSHGIYQKKY